MSTSAESPNLSGLNDRIKALEKQVNDLIANSNVLLARQTASAAVINVLLWGWGKSRKEVGDEILKSGGASLAEINKLSLAMKQEVVDIWNLAHSKLMGPSHQAFHVGEKPG